MRPPEDARRARAPGMFDDRSAPQMPRSSNCRSDMFDRFSLTLGRRAALIRAPPTLGSRTLVAFSRHWLRHGD